MSEIVTDQNLPPDYERRLANGALVVCGPCMVSTLAGLKSAGALEGSLAVCSDRAATLALPDTLMIHALLLYCHRIPGIKGRGPTRAELADWRNRWLAGVTFAQAGEPEPKTELTADAQSDEVMLQVTWSPAAGRDWRGVRSAQVKRVALAVEAAALAQGAPAVGSGDTPPRWGRYALAALFIIMILGAAVYLKK